jgi:vacuolar-type H+-ATPase subunit E/Vma4
MGGTSEREFRQKLAKIKEKAEKQAKDVRKTVSRVEQIKEEALKKAEEIRRSADSDVNKLEGKIVKSKDLAPESKQRLTSETAMLRNSIDDEYQDLRRRIAETLIPVLA